MLILSNGPWAVGTSHTPYPPLCYISRVVSSATLSIPRRLAASRRLVSSLDYIRHYESHVHYSSVGTLCLRKYAPVRPHKSSVSDLFSLVAVIMTLGFTIWLLISQEEDMPESPLMGSNCSVFGTIDMI